MEQFIGCDAHKKFSVFVAVNEKGHAGEALRVAHDRHLYREDVSGRFAAKLPRTSLDRDWKPDNFRVARDTGLERQRIGIATLTRC